MAVANKKQTKAKKKQKKRAASEKPVTPKSHREVERIRMGNKTIDENLEAVEAGRPVFPDVFPRSYPRLVNTFSWQAEYDKPDPKPSPEELTASFKEAISGNRQILHETVLLAGYQSEAFTFNPWVWAEMTGIREETLRQWRNHPRWPGSGQDNPEAMDAAFEDIAGRIDLVLLALLQDARDGFNPLLDNAVLAAGYQREWLVDTQAEVAAHFDVDERTIRRWVADGMPTQRRDGERKYSCADILRWKHGSQERWHSPRYAELAKCINCIWNQAGYNTKDNESEE